MTLHEDKETGLAEVCAEVGVPYILSTASSSTIEEVAEAKGGGKDGTSSTGSRTTT
jgi:isopentenyl diphosphate isomerase/L-lactate dehydrogenase-like FMN-dependent dehydrogenase